MLGSSVWRVAVIIGARNATGPAFAQFFSLTDTATMKAERLQNLMRGLGIAANVGMVAAGAAIIGGINAGMNQAAKLQMALQQIHVATGATGTQLQDIHWLALQTTQKTSLDVQTMLSMFQQAHRGGLTTEQLQGNGGYLYKQMSYLADLIYRSPGPGMGGAPEQSMYKEAELAHMMGAYQGPQMKNALEEIYVAMRTTPLNLDTLITQGKYFVSLMHNLGATPKDIVETTMGMSILGYGTGRGGTGIKTMLLSMAGAYPHADSLKNARTQALLQLGVLGLDHGKLTTPWATRDPKTGKESVDVMGMLENMVLRTDKMSGAQRTRLMEKAFLQMGTPLMTGMTNPQFMEQMHRLIAEQSHIRQIGIEKAQEDIVGGTYEGAMNMLKTNLVSLVQEGFLPMVNAVTPLVKMLADGAALLTDFAFANQKLMLAITAAMGVAGFGLIFTGLRGLVTAALTSYVALQNLARGMNQVAVSSELALARQEVQNLGLVPGGSGTWINSRTGNAALGDELKAGERYDTAMAAQIAATKAAAAESRELTARNYMAAGTMAKFGMGLRGVLSIMTFGLSEMLIAMGPIGWAVVGVVALGAGIWYIATHAKQVEFALHLAGTQLKKLGASFLAAVASMWYTVTHPGTWGGHGAKINPHILGGHTNSGAHWTPAQIAAMKAFGASTTAYHYAGPGSYPTAQGRTANDIATNDVLWAAEKRGIITPASAEKLKDAMKSVKLPDQTFNQVITLELDGKPLTEAVIKGVIKDLQKYVNTGANQHRVQNTGMAGF